jgi:hypothetical protein
MSGCPEVGWYVKDQLLSGWQAIGCAVPAAGYGMQATGSKQQDSGNWLWREHEIPAIGPRGNSFEATRKIQAGSEAANKRSGFHCYQPRILAKISGATIVASDSMTYFGVSTLSFPHVIFSLGTAPEYDPKLVVESLIWQK